MTRICRAQFESQDIAESQVICGRSENGNSGSIQSESLGLQEIHSNERLTRSALVTLSRSEPPIMTWRLPDWVNFSYSTARQRMRNPTRHQPNPFGPHRPSFARLSSTPLDTQDSRNPKPDDAPAQVQEHHYRSNHQRIDGATEPPQFERSVEEQPRKRTSEPRGPVVPHPPPIPWDDQSNVDLPYDNPYYTRTIDNVLWLPRDPFGILDLDDTVDLRVSLTCEPKSGQIGTWLGTEEVTLQPQPTTSVASAATGSNPSRVSLPRQYTGSEEIDLPFAIAKRVQALEKEDDVEYTGRNRPSMFRRGSSSTGMEMAGIRRPSVFESPPPMSYRSFSAGSGNRPRASSAATSTELTRIGRSVSADPRLPVEQPEVRSQSDLLPPLRQSETIRSREGLSRIQTIGEAVAQEVIVEEEDARHERLKEEQDEANKATMTKQSWLTSWLFTKA